MPQPIDMQSELGRTLAAERIQDAAARAAMLSQQRAQQEDERLRADRERQVSETPQTESEGVDQDGRGRQERANQKRSAKTQGKPTNARRRPYDPGEGHAFDVTV